MVALLIIGIGKLSDVIFYVEKPKTPGYKVEVKQVTDTNSESTLETTELEVDIASLMAMGDLARSPIAIKLAISTSNSVVSKVDSELVSVTCLTSTLYPGVLGFST